MVAGGGLVSDGSQEDIDASNQPFTKLVARVAALAAIGGFLFGYDTGIVSGAMIYMEESLELDDIWKEIVVSITILGAWMFSMIAGPLATKYGRKKVVYIASAIFTVGSFVMAFAQEKYSMSVGRFIVGAGIGLASMIVPMFIAEMAPSRYRGSLVTTNNLFIAGGQAVASIVAGGLGYIEGDLSWRLMLGLAAVPAILQFIGFLTVPESPRWLMQVGREDEAKCALQLLRGESSIIDKEFEGIKNSCNNSNKTNSEEDHPTSTVAIISKVMKDKHLRMALIVGCLLQTVQQLTGINTVMYYTATIIKMSGIHDKQEAVWMASATANMNFLVNFLGILLVERVGRRWLTLGSLMGVILSLGVLAVGFQVLDNTSPTLKPFDRTNTSLADSQCFDTSKYDTCSKCVFDPGCVYCYSETQWDSFNHCFPINGTKGTSKSKSVDETYCNATAMTNNKEIVLAEDWCPSPHSWLVLFGLCIYLFFFGPGLGPMPWTINSELFPLWCRSTCYSITTAFNWLFNMLVSLTFLSLTRVITKAGVFWLYTAFGVLGLVFFLFFLPETKGRSLESDIGVLLEQQEEMARRRASSTFRGAGRRLSSVASRKRSEDRIDS